MKVTLNPTLIENTSRHYLLSLPLTNGGIEIASWLEDDVTRLEEIFFWRSRIKEISSENIICLGSGNAHHVYIVGPYVYIFCEYVDAQQVMMHTHDFLELLNKYEAYLNQKKDGAPQPFEVTYAHQGSAASAIFEREQSDKNEEDGDA